MPHFVYILETARGYYYIGYTNNLEKRMATHRSGKGAKFVRGFGFKRLLYHERFRTKSRALKREAELKKWSRLAKERLIKTTS